MFANGGNLVKPTLIRKIVKRNEEGVEEVLFETASNQRRVLTQERAKQILTALKYSTKIGGTARRADVWGYTDAGKTGTADKAIKGVYNPHYVCASIVGIVPADQPAFVMIVAMDEPEYGYEPGIGRKHMGGTCAAPVFKEIAQRSLEYLGIAPDDIYGYPKGDPRSHPQKADWFPEIRQLQEKYEKWNNK
jgi:cell division protein FtsI (penicillin-binding protein 3)